MLFNWFCTSFDLILWMLVVRRDPKVMKQNVHRLSVSFWSDGIEGCYGWSRYNRVRD